MSKISNETIVKSLSENIWSQMESYVRKGYLEKKVYIKPSKKVVFNKNFEKLETWNIFNQRKTEIIKYINTVLLLDSGLELKSITLSWEIFNDDKIFHNFTFNVVPVVPTPSEELSLESQKPVNSEKSNQQFEKKVVNTLEKKEKGVSSRFIVSSSELKKE